MRARHLLVVGCFLGAAIAAGGCGKTDAGSPSDPAAINGSQSAAKPSDGTAAKPARPKSDPAHPVVVIDTSMGPITVTLDAEKAPLTVTNLLGYIANGHYDQTIFHQVLKDYVVMGGGYTPQGAEKKARPPIFNEADNGLKNVRGAIAMVRQPGVINSATCQFYINVTENPNLDFKNRTPEEYGYCVFGKVTAGMEVVDRIAAVAVQDRGEFERIPVEPVIIKSIQQTQ